MSEEVKRYLAFSLNGERFAIPLLKTREVAPLGELTPVPFTPPYFKGIMNLRGQVVSVMDLREKLALEHAPLGAENAIVVLDLFTGGPGLIVDSVDAVLSFKASELSPMPPVVSSLGADCLAGVARRDATLYLLLDVEKIAAVKALRAAA